MEATRRRLQMLTMRRPWPSRQPPMGRAVGLPAQSSTRLWPHVMANIRTRVAELRSSCSLPWRESLWKERRSTNLCHAPDVDAPGRSRSSRLSKCEHEYCHQCGKCAKCGAEMIHPNTPVVYNTERAPDTPARIYWGSPGIPFSVTKGNSE